MNPRLRTILVAIGFLTLAIIAIVLVPRGLSLFYQSRGGQHIDYVMRSVEGIQELVCEPLPESNQAAIDEVKKGVANLQQAVRFNSRNSQAYYQLGKAYCLLGEPETAVENYLVYTDLRPDNPLGHIGLGFAYEVLGEEEKTKEAWLEAGLKPNGFKAVGDEFYKLGDLQTAEKWYQRALLVNPDDFESIFSIGSVYEARNEWESAIDAYKQITIIDPINAKANNKIGEILLNQFNEYQLALYYFDVAVQGEKLPVKAYVGIGDANYRLGEYEQALSAYRKAVLLSVLVEGNSSEDQWKKVWPHYALGALLLNMEQYKEAKDSFQIGMELDTTNRWRGWLLWGLGRISLLNGDYESAEGYFADILNSTDYIFLRSQAYYGMSLSNIYKGEIEIGLNQLLSAVEEHPQNRDLHKEYIRKLIEYDFLFQAREELEMYLNIWPEDLEAKNLLASIGGKPN